MGKSIKCRPDHLCIAIFALCLSVRFAEYFLIETDKTAIGENIIHKAIGIIILAVILKRLNLTWSDIGFQRKGFVSGIFKGLLLGSVCFTISYGLEFAILAWQGNPAHLEIYISSFSLTGAQAKNTGVVFFVSCVLFNIVNVWMEEGIFRGLFIKTLSGIKPFMKANFIAAFLFGVWHMVMPVRSYVNGEMSFAAMVLMGIGYMILAGIMGIKWGLLYRMTGNIWAGFGDHLFNNTVAANMLHVVSLKGADELQIVRIMAAQMISFAVVVVIYFYRNKKADLRESIYKKNLRRTKMIKLVRPTEAQKEQALEFRQEFFDNGESVINGSELFDQTDDYGEWCRSVEANTKEETVNPDWVITDTYFAVDENDRIVGIIDLRHTLNDFLKDLGNCGYSVRPSERRKGIATEMLRQLADAARKAGMSELHLSVEKNNEPSVKTILRNGGVYERSFELDGEQADIYRIAL